MCRLRWRGRQQEWKWERELKEEQLEQVWWIQMQELEQQQHWLLRVRLRAHVLEGQILHDHLGLVRLVVHEVVLGVVQ